jgi:hypothetical protein
VLERADDELFPTVMPRRRAPVHVADVVARKVQPELAKLQALPSLPDLTDEVPPRIEGCRNYKA